MYILIKEFTIFSLEKKKSQNSEEEQKNVQER